MFVKSGGVLIILLGIFAGGYCSDWEEDRLTRIELHHALSVNPEKFSFRGNVTIWSLNYGEPKSEQLSVSIHELNKLKELASQDDFYRLQATVEYPDGNKLHFLTSSKACSLLKSQLKDTLWISLDAFGYVNAVTQSISSANMECSAKDMMTVDKREFNTDIYIKNSVKAPVPDLASYIRKLKREREEKERGEIHNNRTFFAKYWMYIVPSLLVFYFWTG